MYQQETETASDGREFNARPIINTFWSLVLFCTALVWSACRAVGLELPPGFVGETLATNLNAATAICATPDGRIFIAQQTGRLLVWKEGGVLERPALTLRVADYWERGLIGVTFAPDFLRRPQLFILYVRSQPFAHHVLSRFAVNGDTVDPASELVLFEGDDQATLGGTQEGAHQGGPIRFGQDGKLYVAIGEQTAGEPAQKLDTLLGKVLRLNPDGSIPTDNPFVTKTTGKYRAIYAYGIRNPFGLALQRETGRIFFTDVGSSAFEEVNELTAGANYGWPRAEGYSTNPEFKRPLYAYPPTIGQSICGGTFYPVNSVETSNRSTFPAKWRGKFFFVDFMKHWLKALEPDAPTNVVTFARGLNGPVAVEAAPDGSLLVLNRGTIWRDPKRFVTNSGSLVRIRYGSDSSFSRKAVAAVTNDATVAAGVFPGRLEEMPRKLTRAAWERLTTAKTGETDGWLAAFEWNRGVKEEARFMLPPGRKLRLEPGGGLRFPAGTVFIRNFLVFDHPGLRLPYQPLETRIIVMTSESSAFGCSYHWTSGKEAELVEDGEQASRAITTEKGVAGEMLWWFPAQEPSLSLPSTAPAYVVPQHAIELNVRHGNGPTLLQNLAAKGLCDPPSASEWVRSLPEVSPWTNEAASAETRVRAYLQGNCAVCHQPGGPSRGLFDARLSTPLAQAGLINGPVAAGDLGIAGAGIIVPGSPEKSILYQRLKRTDFFRMPPVKFHNDLPPILPVLAEWIRSLRPEESAARKNRN